MRNKIGRLISVLFLLTGLSTATGQINQGNRFKIKAHIKGVSEGTIFFLIKARVDGDGPDTVQVSKSKKDKFEFSGTLALPGEIYWIIMDTAVLKLEKGKNTWISLVMDNDIIELEGSLTNWPDISIKGSTPTLEYLNYLAQEKKVLGEVQKFYAKANTDSAAITKGDELFKRFVLSYYETALDSYMTPRFITKSSLLNSAEKKELYTKLSVRVQRSFYGKKLRDYLDLQDRVSKISALAKTEGKIPDFTFTALDGSKQSIMKLASTSKYTLIDFWASWCAPCRASVPGLKKVYEEFHGKGFNIVGLSTDKNEAAWKKAIEQDQTFWFHGLDNIDKASKTIFPLSAIPAYILIDNKGRILHTDYFLSTGSEGTQVKIVKEGQKSLGKNLKEIINTLLQ